MGWNWAYLTSGPVLMGVELLVALAFAIGHHAFYQKLNGTLVRNSGPSWITRKLSYDVSDQQINVSIGTFFAFLVKALLGAAVSIAFDQFTWRKVINSASARIAIIDDLFAALKNGFVMFNLKLWWRYPTSMLLATLIWLLPIASVISPATLNVQMAPFSNHTMRRVPRVDFKSANFASMATAAVFESNVYLDSYMGITPEVQRIATSTATQGSILGITPLSTNSSWSIGFHGPSLNCTNVNQTLYNAIVDDVEKTINASYKYSLHQNAGAYGFISWVPFNDTMAGMMPFYDGANITANDVNSAAPRSAELGPTAEKMMHQTSMGEGNLHDYDTPLSIFIAAFPHMIDDPTKNLSKAFLSARDPTIIQCSLCNSSYETTFNYVNGEQRISVDKQVFLNTVPYLAGVGFFHGIGADESVYDSVWERFSYQAVMASFGKLLVGAACEIFESQKESPALGAVSMYNTTVMSTSLSNTQELQVVKTALNKVSSNDTFDTVWRENSVRESIGNGSLSLLDATEEMFRNITISMISSGLFQPNYTLPSAPSNANVTMTTWSDVYVYSRSILWTAYGVALGVTLLSTCLGIAAHFTNHGSYSTKFSTILRATQQVSVSTTLKPEDCSGKDPLPGYIAKSTISFFGKKITDNEMGSARELTNIPHVREVSGVSGISDDEGGYLRDHSRVGSRSPSPTLSGRSIRHNVR